MGTLVVYGIGSLLAVWVSIINLLPFPAAPDIFGTPEWIQALTTYILNIPGADFAEGIASLVTWNTALVGVWVVWYTLRKAVQVVWYRQMAAGVSAIATETKVHHHSGISRKGV